MWIEGIDIDDFGCFNRARLGKLSNGLTVISGPQRAGKSTFMHAVRCLGYGISKSDAIPPPSDTYDLTADLVTNEGTYECSITGFSDPTITPRGNAPERSAQELYGKLGKTQYQQLYTISLDELRRVPHSLDTDTQLSAILLGAAYGEILDVPEVRDTLGKQAKSIGGKHGRGVYDMGEPMERISEGIEERDQALEQVETYENTAREREEVTGRIKEIDTETEQLTTERTRLEAVRANHDEYQRLQELNEEVAAFDAETIDSFPVDRLDRAKHLEERYNETIQSLQHQHDQFSAVVSVEDPAAYRRRLLDTREAIDAYTREKAAWEERLRTVENTQRDLQERKRELQHRIESLHPDWDRDLSHVRNLDIDLVSRDLVRTTVESYLEVKDDVDELKQQISELEDRESDLETRIEEAVETTGSRELREQGPRIVIGSAIAIIAGLGAGFAVGPALGVIVTSVVFIATGAYVGSHLQSNPPTHDGVAVDSLRSERQKLASERTSRETTLEKRQARLEELAQDLAGLRESYGLPADMSVEAIKEFHQELIHLREAVIAFDDDEREFERDRDALRETLSDVAHTLASAGVLTDEPDDPLADATNLFAVVDRAGSHLENAAEVATVEQRKTRVERESIELLAEWDTTEDLTKAGDETVLKSLRSFLDTGEAIETALEAREAADRCRARLRTALKQSSVENALETYRKTDQGEEWHVNAYEGVLDDFGDIDAVSDRIDAIGAQLTALAEERKELAEERIELNAELEKLRSDEDVRESHATIEQGRKGLEPLAEDYASLRIAEYLLDELHERFVDRTTGPLLDEAAEIFERITGSTYVGLDSVDEFEQLDFEATLDDGQTQRSGELSRATAEQLFLAVRLAKIKQHPEPLPVLLDDSLTNFDPVHVDRTLQIIDELASETQVFLLTCHPSLLAQLDQHLVVSQYWALEDGEFDGPYETPETPQAALAAETRRATVDD